MAEQMVTVTFQVPRRDAARLVAIVAAWVGGTVLSDRAFERWSKTERALDAAVVAALRENVQTPWKEGGDADAR